MTLSPWIIYLWGLADEIKCLFGISAFLSITVTIVYCIWKGMGDGEIRNLKFLKNLIIISFVLGLSSAFIPSSKTIAIMVVAPAIINSKPIQKDLPELYSVAIEALKNSLTNTNK